jgi:hypothetical protein
MAFLANARVPLRITSEQSIDVTDPLGALCPDARRARNQIPVTALFYPASEIVGEEIFLSIVQIPLPFLRLTSRIWNSLLPILIVAAPWFL